MVRLKQQSGECHTASECQTNKAQTNRAKATLHKCVARGSGERARHQTAWLVLRELIHHWTGGGCAATCCSLAIPGGGCVPQKGERAEMDLRQPSPDTKESPAQRKFLSLSII